MTRLYAYRGFTIVEIAVVLLVIGILMAIGSVSYSNVQTTARNAEASEELSQFGRTLVKYKANHGAYPSSTNELTGDYRVSFTPGLFSTDINLNLIYCSKSPYDDYVLTAVTKKGKRLYIKNTGSPEEYKGMTSWTGTAAATICSSILSGTSNAGPEGWNGTWRPWVNGS
ncbi:MAG TPA: prepilin-type N-terminal cleavage/methylation domain-containing protein [Candidatus Saccharibacteria bacterium]|nr:prepilin-type N-terminal cleavage/methylation domain-containing protein [Candidatus Saccharibacteria bacterium]